MAKHRVGLALLAILAWSGCATSGSHGGSFHSSHSASHESHSASRSGGHASHSSSGHPGSSDDSLASTCLGILCDASVCAVNGAVDDDDDGDDETAPNGDHYVDPPDPIMGAADETPPPPGVQSPPPGAPAPPVIAPVAQLASAPGASPAQLTVAIDLAWTELRNHQLATFVSTFLSSEDRAALASQPTRNVIAELTGVPGARLRAQLDACRKRGAQAVNDRAQCRGPAPSLRWRAEAAGWVIDGLLDDLAQAARTKNDRPASHSK